MTNSYANRLRTSLVLQQPTGLWTNRFAYDVAGRLTNVVSPAGVFGYTLGGSGPASALIKKLLLPNTAYITNTFDSVARLTGTWLKNNGDTALDYATYGYNTANQRLTFTNTAGTYSSFAYDRIGQLKVKDSSVNPEDRGYMYDTAWNLNFRTNNGAIETFTVGSKNQLTTTPLGSCSYDSNGNLLSYVTQYGSGTVTRSLTYDDENRLISAAGSTVYRSDFVYDGLGRMRKKLDYTWNGTSWAVSATAEYIYDGLRMIQERDSGNTPIASYTRGTDLSGSLEVRAVLGACWGGRAATPAGTGRTTIFITPMGMATSRPWSTPRSRFRRPIATIHSARRRPAVPAKRLRTRSDSRASNPNKGVKGSSLYFSHLC